MLSRRFMTAICLGIFSVTAIFFEQIYVMAVVLLIALGLLEFFGMIEKKGIPVYKYFGTVVGIIIPLSTYLRFELTRGWELLFLSMALGALFILQFSRRESTNAVLGISTLVFGVFYIAWFFSYMIKLKMLPYGTVLAGSLLLITKGADVGAFLIGVKWGRRSLLPRISPKKTIEGALGGVFFGVLGALASKSFLPDLPVFSWMNLIFLGVGLSCLAILGDLSESLIKRDCAAKDSGAALPGMGGVLDVIDSLLFTAPAFYFYMNYYLSRSFESVTGF